MQQSYRQFLLTASSEDKLNLYFLFFSTKTGEHNKYAFPLKGQRHFLLFALENSSVISENEIWSSTSLSTPRSSSTTTAY